MNTYEKTETTVVIPQQLPELLPQEEKSFAEKAKDLFQQVGEKMGLVDPTPTYSLNTTEIKVTPLPPSYDLNSEKTFSEKAKETLVYAGEKLGLVNPDSSKPPSEQAKDNLYLAGERAGSEVKEKFHEIGEIAEQWKNDFKDKAYYEAGKAGLVFPYTDTTGLPRPMGTDQAKKEILEVIGNIGLAHPEETPEEFGHAPIDNVGDRPLSSEKIKDEILEARENLGLKKPFETKAESGKAPLGQDQTFQKSLPA